MDPRLLDHTARQKMVDRPLRPELRARLRFLQEVVLVPFGDEILVDGGGQMQVLQGQGVQKLFLRLIPLLDGSRTNEEVERELPDVPAPNVRKAISTLRSYGLIEAAAPDSAPELFPNSDALAFFRRHIAATWINANGIEAALKLRKSRVAIFGSLNDLTRLEILRSLLEKTGIVQVTILDSGSFNRWDQFEQYAPPLLVSCSFGSENRDWHLSLDNWCFQHKLSWLRIVVDDQANCADIGPLFTTSNPCYQCFTHSTLTPSNHIGFRTEPTPSDVHFWSSLVAIEIIYLLSGIGPTTDVRDFLRVETTGWRVNHFRWPRVPGCQRCRPLRLISDGISSATGGEQCLMDSAVVFEDYVGFPPLASLARQTHSGGIHDSAVLIRETKRMLNCPQHALKRQVFETTSGILDMLCRDIDGSDRPITVDDVATMLMVTGGIRSFQAGAKDVQRWAATGGNLGSVELFVTIRHVEGLEPGNYFYQPYNHALGRFQPHSGALGPDDFTRRVIGWDANDLPDLLVIFTGAFHRVARKYGVFGYRLVNLDAGVAASQLQVVAKSLGISSKVAFRWADDLIEEQLNLDQIGEQCTAVMALFRGKDKHGRIRQTPWPLSSSELRPGTPPSAKRPADLSRQPPDALLEVLYEDSRIKEAALGSTPFAFTSKLSNPRHTLSTPVTLPTASAGGREVARVLAARVSVRHYTDQFVSLDQLSTMLYCAQTGDQEDWPEEHQLGLSLTFLVLARKVAGLRVGVYEYRIRQNSLNFSHDASSFKDLFVQPEFGRAPLSIWIVGNLAAACARHGTFGHRQLLLRAGAAGNRLWMASLGMGLSGTLSAGLIADAALEQLGLDGYERASLLAFVAGYGDREVQPLYHRRVLIP